MAPKGQTAGPEGVAPSFRAGGYVQITCPPYRAKYANFEIDPAYLNDI